jgi:hypothetical protein
MISAVSSPGTPDGQPLSHPLANATLQEVHAYPWPDPKWQDVSAPAWVRSSTFYKSKSCFPCSGARLFLDV